MNKRRSSNQVRDEGLDKFYTIPSISKKCIEEMGYFYDWDIWDLVIEPSAGDGSFLIQLPTERKIGIDILPDHKDIIEKDFFDYYPPRGLSYILVIGNPPFGRNNSLSINFFNHAAEWADVIAFILPRTFRRISVQNKLNLNFHLLYDNEIPSEPCSFKPSMMAKCCFQIWEKRSKKRSIIKLPTYSNDWDFLSYGPKDKEGQPTPPKNADFALRAYGGKCGEIVLDNLDTLRPKSWHWIKSKIEMNILIERFKSLDYSLSLDTARQNSIGKGELVQLYYEKYKKDEDDEDEYKE
jgi:hypothetical protein